MPLGALYALGGQLRTRFAKPRRASVPVLCVGNLVAGGVGKTPVAIALARWFSMRGKSPAFLTRGYGGQQKGPLWVDLDHHKMSDVGDEPLLLAQVAPTIVSADRAAGGTFSSTRPIDVLIMDDGFQNPGLHKDLSILVVDGATGFGNGRLIPAGPLREPIASGARRAAAVVIIGDDRAGVRTALASHISGPVLRADIVPSDDQPNLAGRRVLAFAGIGRPQKFFDTLRRLGAELVDAKTYPDHHPYTDNDLGWLRAFARENDASLITTEKDLVRIAPAVRTGIETVKITAKFVDDDKLADLLSALC